MLPSLLKHWRIIAVVAALIAAFAGGRFLAPTRTLVTTDVQEQARLREQVTSLQQAVQTFRVSTEQRLVALQRERTATVDRNHVREETKPDGTRIVDRTETTSHTDDRTSRTDDDRKAAVVAATTTTAAAASTVDLDAARRTTVTRNQAAGQPRLLVGLSVGPSIPALLGGTADRQILPFVPHVILGTLSLDARLFGPLYGGVWASTTGAMGLSLRLGLR